MIDKIKEKLKDLNCNLSFNVMPQEAKKIFDTILVFKELLQYEKLLSNILFLSNPSSFTEIL